MSAARTVVSIWALVSVAWLWGCDDGGGMDEPEDTSTEGIDTETETASESDEVDLWNLVVDLSVPEEFAGETAEALVVSFWEELPSNFAVLPDGICAFAGTPFLADPPIDEIVSFLLEAPMVDFATLQQPLAGEYYINITVFVLGGGFAAHQPEEGKDWSYTSTIPFTLGDADLDLGDLELTLFDGIPTP